MRTKILILFLAFLAYGVSISATTPPQTQTYQETGFYEVPMVEVETIDIFIVNVGEAVGLQRVANFQSRPTDIIKTNIETSSNDPNKKDCDTVYLGDIEKLQVRYSEKPNSYTMLGYSMKNRQNIS